MFPSFSPFPAAAVGPRGGEGGNVRSGNVNEKVLCVRRKYELQLYVCHKKIKKIPFLNRTHRLAFRESSKCFRIFSQFKKTFKKTFFCLCGVGGKILPFLPPPPKGRRKKEGIVRLQNSHVRTEKNEGRRTKLEKEKEAMNKHEKRKRPKYNIPLLVQK